MEHGYGTHAIPNQTPPLRDYNLFGTDKALQEAVQREGAAWALPGLLQAGDALGTSAVHEHARLANRSPRYCIITTRKASASTGSSFTPPGMN